MVLTSYDKVARPLVGIPAPAHVAVVAGMLPLARLWSGRPLLPHCAGGKRGVGLFGAPPPLAPLVVGALGPGGGHGGWGWAGGGLREHHQHHHEHGQETNASLMMPQP